MTNPHFIVTLVPGDGIGPEIAAALVSIFKAAEVPITWDAYTSPSNNPGAFHAIVESARKHQLMIKGPLTTEVAGGGCFSNLILRVALDLFADALPFKSSAGVESRWDDVDLLVIRENTKGACTGVEYDARRGTVDAIEEAKEASLRVAEYAFLVASRRPRRELSVAHKEDIMKKPDGLLLRCCREVAKKYPFVCYREILVDNCCEQLVLDPGQFDVLVLEYLYGGIVSGLCGGLVGGMDLVPSATIGPKCAMFETVHGIALDIAGKGIANPAALILSGVLLLRHVHLDKEADRIEQAVRSVIRHGKFTALGLGGGSATTKAFTDVVIRTLHEPARESLLSSFRAKNSFETLRALTTGPISS
jgi:isocitrate dehydrogenase (NAD+)